MFFFTHVILLIIPNSLSLFVILSCVVFRPPGHHSQRSEANGFCVFNNVAIATLYAKKHYNLNRYRVDYGMRDKMVLACATGNEPLAVALSGFHVFRVLIVDWDIHHGQGVQYCFEEDSR